MWWFKKKQSKQSKESKNTIFSGYALLIIDSISGKKQWATFNAGGKEHTNYPPMTPLVFPTESKLPLGTKVEIHIPID